MTIENENGGDCIDREKVEGEGEESHGNELQDGDAHNTEQSSEEVMSIDDKTPIDSMNVDSVVSVVVYF